MSDSLSDSRNVNSRDTRQPLIWAGLLLLAGLLAATAIFWMARPQTATQTTVQSTGADEAAIVAPSVVMPCETNCMDEFYANQYSGANRPAGAVTSESNSATTVVEGQYATYTDRYWALAQEREASANGLNDAGRAAPCETNCLDDLYAAQYGGLKQSELSGAARAAAIEGQYATYTDRYWALAQAGESTANGVDESSTIDDRLGHQRLQPR